MSFGGDTGTTLDTDLYINGNSYIMNDYYNSFSDNKMARFYNEFKKFRYQCYNKDDAGCVDLNSFTNLHRIYLFDISKQVETITNGVNNVKLDFQFNTPIHQSAVTTAYCVSFFDRIWKLSSDGTKQYIIK